MLTSHEIRRDKKGQSQIRAWHRPNPVVENFSDNKTRDLKAQIRGETAARQKAEAEAVSARAEAAEARSEAARACERASLAEGEALRLQDDLAQAEAQYLDNASRLQAEVSELRALVEDLRQELGAERAKPKGTVVTRKDQTARIVELEAELATARLFADADAEARRLRFEIEIEKRVNEILTGVTRRK